MSITVDSLEKKLDTLFNLDPNFELFGANTHGYEHNPPLSEEEVSRFEAEHHVTLPEEYRRYLVEMGNGGAGPVYGIKPLAPWTPDHYVQVTSRITGKDGEVLAEAGTGPRPTLYRKADPAKPFPLTGPWSIPEAGSSPAQDANPYDGCTYLADIGCGYFYFLVLNGPHAGEVWEDYTAGDGQIAPTGKSFFQWYDAWLEDSLAEMSGKYFLTLLKNSAAVNEEINVEESVSILERAILRNPNWTLAEIWLAAAKAYQGDYEGAERCLARALSAHAGFALDVATTRVAILWSRAMKDGALLPQVVEAAQRALGLPDFNFPLLKELHEVRVLALRLLGRLEEALKAVEEQLEFDQNALQSWLHKAQIQVLLGDRSAGEATIREAAARLSAESKDGFRALADRLQREDLLDDAAYFYALSGSPS